MTRTAPDAALRRDLTNPYAIRMDMASDIKHFRAEKRPVTRKNLLALGWTVAQIDGHLFPAFAEYIHRRALERSGRMRTGEESPTLFKEAI